MKNKLLLLLTIPLLLASCTRDPFADFTMSSTWVGAGENVYFTNRSVDADRFEWDFGDGFVSNSFNASHFYDQTGDYVVRLKAYSNNSVSTSQMNIRVGADLEITVEEYLEPFYLVTDISVRLYPTVTDWENQTNMIVEGFTDSNGKVSFDYLYNNRYYIDVWGPNHDNYQLAAEDVGWIETPVLLGGTLNLFTAVVDYYPPAKKSSLNRLDLKAARKTEAAGHPARIKPETR
jgi:hypothetical protein